VPTHAARLTGAWRGFALALAALALAGAAILALAPRFAGAWLLAVYCIPANSILPIPHEPGVLLVAPYYAPIWCALAATAGSVVASFSDYAVVEHALRRPRIAALRDRGAIGWAVRWMRRAPFAIIVACSLVPLLPISIVRALAPAAGYPLRRYVVAQIVGRLPRFYALAWLGNAIAIPWWALAIVTAVTLAVAIAGSRTPPAVVQEAAPR
jgi:membrane protein YqaA with SNARE-associated domain